MIRPLRDQVMVITGASSGIGRATALEAARRGARVVLAARNADDLHDVAEQIRREGGDALVVPTDMTDFAQAEALARRAADEYGRIDAWVNGAAATVYGTFKETPIEDFRRAVDVILMSQVYGAKAALPFLEETGGALICVGSVLSDRGMPLMSAYSAAKHAIKGWLDGLRVELKKEGSPVRVTLVKPASINTPLFEKARTHMGVAPRPLPPIYAPELAAEAILHAAVSDERDVFVGGAGKLLSLAERVSPKMVDLSLRVGGFRAQRTKRRKAADAPNNLYAPLEHDGGVRGEWRDKETKSRAYDEVVERSVATSFAAATALGLGALAARKATPDSTIPAGLLALGALTLAGKGLLAAVVER